jgi:long-chain acyl-CoA synthetase
MKNDEILGNEDVTATLRHPESAEELLNQPFGVDNIYNQFQIGVKKFGDEPCFGTRLYIYDQENTDTTKQVLKARGEFRWLLQGGRRESSEYWKGSTESGNCGQEQYWNFSINRAEWCIASLGIYSCAYRTVPLYDSLGDRALEYIIMMLNCQ